MWPNLQEGVQFLRTDSTFGRRAMEMWNSEDAKTESAGCQLLVGCPGGASTLAACTVLHHLGIIVNV
jgi:hypothetical protein